MTMIRIERANTHVLYLRTIITEMEKERDYLRQRLVETLRLYDESCAIATQSWLDNRRFQDELQRTAVDANRHWLENSRLRQELRRTTVELDLARRGQT
jgi:hypothetical protein